MLHDAPSIRLDMADEDTLVAEFSVDASLVRDREIRCARTLAALAETNARRYSSPASVGEFGERFAVSADRARVLLSLGRAMKVDPSIEAKVRAGRMPVESAAVLGEVLSDPRLQRPGDRWEFWAETDSTKRLRQRLLRRREESVRNHQPVVALTVYVSPPGRDGFDRARVIASRKARHTLSPGQTLERVVDYFLDEFDPERVRPGKRRMPDTALVTVHGAAAAGDGFRSVPAEVQREVYERRDGRCAVPFCDRTIFLEMAHVIAHSHDGDREAHNLIVLCSYHHDLLDGGLLRMAGSTENPVFFDENGNDLSRRYGANGSHCPPTDVPDTPSTRPAETAPERDDQKERGLPLGPAPP